MDCQVSTLCHSAIFLAAAEHICNIQIALLHIAAWAPHQMFPQAPHTQYATQSASLIHDVCLHIRRGMMSCWHHFVPLRLLSSPAVGCLCKPSRWTFWGFQGQQWPPRPWTWSRSMVSPVTRGWVPALWMDALSGLMVPCRQHWLPHY